VQRLRTVDLARINFDRILAAIKQLEVLARRAINWRISSCDRKVGVPPPQCSCITSCSPSR
jgi:hypothetical protein